MKKIILSDHTPVFLRTTIRLAGLYNFMLSNKSHIHLLLRSKHQTLNDKYKEWMLLNESKVVLADKGFSLYLGKKSCS